MKGSREEGEDTCWAEYARVSERGRSKISV
jgi:hypothetical protein